MDVITKGTDSAITMVFDSSELDVSKLRSVEIYLQQGNTVLVKTLDDASIDVENNCIILLITENESRKFSASVINLQMRYRQDGSGVTATDIQPIKVYPVIYDKDYEG
jgi:uncharacterized protein YaaQ